MSSVPNAVVAIRSGPPAGVAGGWRGVARFLYGDAVAAGATAVLVALVALVVLGPLVWRHDPVAVDVGNALVGPSAAHPMGTDGTGRDLLARFIYGARLSLIVAPIVVVVGALIGGAIGLCAGVFGGVFDAIAMRVMDAILAFPPLILAMAVTVGLGAGITSAAIGITLTSIPWYARLLRSEALSLRSRPFIEAARALGATRPRIVLRHVLPHVTPTLLIQGATMFCYAILLLAALGFVGLGAQPPAAEWGAMITDGLQYAISGQWWVGVFPGVGLFITVTAANVLADRARDVLDPRAQAGGP